MQHNKKDDDDDGPSSNRCGGVVSGDLDDSGRSNHCGGMMSERMFGMAVVTTPDLMQDAPTDLPSMMFSLHTHHIAENQPLLLSPTAVTLTESMHHTNLQTLDAEIQPLLLSPTAVVTLTESMHHTNLQTLDNGFESNDDDCPELKRSVRNNAQRRMWYQKNKGTLNERRRLIRETNKEAENARKRVAHEANKEANNARHRVAHEANRNAVNARQRAAHEANREAENARRRRRVFLHDSLESVWNQECRYGCGYVHLDSTKDGQLLICCFKGRFSAMIDQDLQDKFRLKPMSATMADIIVNGAENFGPLSSTYNNILSLCATGVKNSHGGGFERRVGDHAITLNGRTFHFIPKATAGTNPSGGMSYFVFDHTAAEAIRNHVLQIGPTTAQNAAAATDDAQPVSTVSALSVELALRIRNELLVINPYCRELHFVGSIISDMALDRLSAQAFQPLRRAAVVNASLGSAVQYYDVAHLTADHATGERTLRFHSVAGEYGEVNMDSVHVEPMIYPILFMHGEPGWGDEDKHDVPYNRYLSSRLLMPDLKSDRVINGKPDFLTVAHATDFVEIVSFFPLLFHCM